VKKHGPPCRARTQTRRRTLAQPDTSPTQCLATASERLTTTAMPNSLVRVQLRVLPPLLIIILIIIIISITDPIGKPVPLLVSACHLSPCVVHSLSVTHSLVSPVPLLALVPPGWQCFVCFDFCIMFLPLVVMVTLFVAKNTTMRPSQSRSSPVPRGHEQRIHAGLNRNATPSVVRLLTAPACVSHLHMP
jgi:hypothetical protein